MFGMSPYDIYQPAYPNPQIHETRGERAARARYEPQLPPMGNQLPHVVQDIGNSPKLPGEVQPTNDGRFKAGNAMSSNRAKKLGHIIISGVGSIKVFDKPRYKSEYHLMPDGKVIKEKANQVPIMIYDGAKFYGNVHDVHKLSTKGVFVTGGFLPPSVLR